MHSIIGNFPYNGKLVSVVQPTLLPAHWGAKAVFVLRGEPPNQRGIGRAPVRVCRVAALGVRRPKSKIVKIEPGGIRTQAAKSGLQILVAIY